MIGGAADGPARKGQEAIFFKSGEEVLMDVSWKKYMQVGLVHFMAFPQVLKGEGPVLEDIGVGFDRRFLRCH